MGLINRNTVATSVAGTLLAAALIGLWNSGGFVTAAAYAADQGKLDQIIQLIADGRRQAQREALNAEITTTERRIEELQLYIDADPDAALTSARQANIRRLQNLKSEAEREVQALDKAAPGAAGP